MSSVRHTIIVAVVALLSIAVSANAFTWYSYNYAGNYRGIPSNYQYQGPTRPTPPQFPPINHFQFPFNQQFPPIIIPPLPPITFPNQFPFNFNGQPIPIPPLPPLSPIQLPQQTQQNYPNSVSQNTQCNNGSCTTIICTNGACQTQTSTGSTLSVTTQCINRVCTTTYH